MFSLVCVKKSVHGGDTPPRQTPPRRPLQRTIRILLECILVLSSNSMNSSTTYCGKTRLFSWPTCLLRVFGSSFTDIIFAHDYDETTNSNITTIRLQNEYWLITVEWIQHLYITDPFTLRDCKSENEFFLWCLPTIFFGTSPNGKNTNFKFVVCGVPFRFAI